MLYIKALHIVFVVTWFAGLFYVVRLFIYLTEATEKPEPEKTIINQQLMVMTSRLWNIITQPSALITLMLGITLLILQPAWLAMPFMKLKLCFVGILFCYHVGCGMLYKRIRKGIFTFSALQLRIYNEIATVLLFAIVFLIVIKDTILWLWGPLGLIIVATGSFLIVRTTNWTYHKYIKKI